MKEQPAGLMNRLTPWMPMTLGTLIWGCMSLPSALALEELDPYMLLALRLVIATTVASAASFVMYRTLRPAPEEFWRLVFMGLTGILGNNLFYFIALKHTSMINVAVIFATTPLQTALLARFVLGEHLGYRRLFGVILAFFGVMLLLTEGNPMRLFSVGLNGGDLWEAAAAFMGAVMTVAAVGVRRTPPVVALWVTMGSGLVGILVVMVLLGQVTIPQHLSSVGIGAVLYLGVLSSCVAYGCQQISALRIGASATAAFSSAVPVLAILVAWAFGGEAMSLLQAGCMGVIFVGVVLNTSARH